MRDISVANCPVYSFDFQQVGADVDENGCKQSAGYSWCEMKQKCIRSFEESCQSYIPIVIRGQPVLPSFPTTDNQVGADIDENGCKQSAG